MASRKFVFPWPFSPMSSIPEAGSSSSTRSRLRKSRIASASNRAAVTTSSISIRPGAGEPWRSLFEKSPCPLRRISRRDQYAKRRRLENKRLVQRHGETAVDGVDTRGDRERSVHEYLLKCRGRGWNELIGSYDTIHQPNPIRLGSVDHLRGEKQLESATTTDDPR